MKNLTMLIAVSALTVGCASIPPVNTSTISTTPASSAAFAEAKRAARACTGLPDEQEMLRRFRALGYRTPAGPDTDSNEGSANENAFILGPLVQHDDGSVIVQAGTGYCYVGLRSMTPEQSRQLAQILVSKYGATTNAENGQGLSDHAVQAWRVQNGGVPKVLIAANKTWPWDRGLWPDVPGAAVTLMTE